MEDKKLVIPKKRYAGETAVVSARIPADLIREVEKICNKTGRSKNDILQMCIEFAVENIEIEN